MASLQDQLLKAGLVDKNKANKTKKEKQKQAKVSRKGGGKSANEIRVAAQQEQARKVAQDRELNRQKQLASDQKALQAQIRQLIQLNRVDREGGDVAYSFVDVDKVKNIHVTNELQKQLSLGRLAIVAFTQGKNRLYELVPTGVAEKIAQRDEHSVVQITAADDSQPEQDDPYAEYQIPDDLMW